MLQLLFIWRLCLCRIVDESVTWLLANRTHRARLTSLSEKHHFKQIAFPVCGLPYANVAGLLRMRSRQ